MATVASRIVEVCVFRFVKNRAEYLLLKRSSTEKLYPDLWQLVSGSINESETAHAAARRELAEETHLTPKHFWVVPLVSSFYDPGADAVNLSAMFAVQVDPDAEPKLSDEHQQYEWLPFPEAHRRLVWPGQKQGLEIVEKYIVGGEEAGRRGLLSLR